MRLNLLSTAHFLSSCHASRARSNSIKRADRCRAQRNAAADLSAAAINLRIEGYVPQLLERYASATQELDHENDERKHEQEVDQATNARERHHSEEPQDE